MNPVGAVASLLHELNVPDQALSPILAHARLVVRDADRLGLVAERTLDEVLLRHSGDSLLFALARRPDAGEVWVDAGSGAGFPGAVLACAFPSTRFVLVEPQQRRAGFLELVAMNLGLGNVSVRRERLGQLGPEIAEVVVARALENPAETVPELRKLLRPGGRCLIATSAEVASSDQDEIADVSRAYIDSPGRVLIMRASR